MCHLADLISVFARAVFRSLARGPCLNVNFFFVANRFLPLSAVCFVRFVSALSRRNPGRDFCQRIYSFKRCLRYSGIRGGGRNGELGKQHTDRNKNYVSRALTLVIGTHTGFSVSFEVASGRAAAAAVQTVVEEGGLGRL